MHNAMRQSVGITPRDDMSISSARTMHANGSTIPAGASSVGRKRSQRACEMCYRKKTKCEVEGPNLICVQCIRRKSKCVFPSQQQQQQQQVSPPQEDYEDIKSDQYVESLKNRLERVESLLLAAGILHESDMSQNALSENEYEDQSDDDRGSSKRPKSSGDVSNLSENSDYCEAAQFPGGGDIADTPLFRGHESDDSRYFGRCCSLSILSRGGIEWIKSKTGEANFLSVVSPDSVDDSPWNQWRPDVFHDLFASQVYKPLPPRSEVFSLIKDFFRTANRLFPIYHEASFMKMVEWQYTQQTCDDAARWASINIVICLAYEFRFSNSLKPEKDREKARLYFKNAMSVFTELALRRTDLLSVQALISMGFFLRGNSGTQFALPFMTAAMRSCQRMGLHRNIARPDLSPVQQEQRRRVFWVAFAVDQSTCLRAGNAPSQHPDDFDVPLPQEMEHDKDSEVSTNIPFFRQLCRMCLIKSRIYCRLYAAKSLLKPPHEIYQTVKELHAELEEWRKDYPFVEVPKLDSAEKDFLFGFASIGLHFVYYNALIMIHRIPLLMNYLISAREDETDEVKSLSKAQASKSALICTTAARDTLSLVNNMPWGDIAWLWSLLYYVFLAGATIFSTILRDTRGPSVKQDLQSLNMAATFFASLATGDGPANYAGFMTRMSATLERIARLAVDRDEKRSRSADDQEEEEEESPVSKRHASRTASAAHPKPTKPRRQRRGSANRPTATLNPNTTTHSHQHHSATPLPSSIASITARSNIPDSSIPEALEGFPPVNSLGYVVPISPDDSPNTQSHQTQPQPQTQQTSTASNNPAGLGLTDLNGANIALNDFTPSLNTFPSWQLAEDYSRSTTSPMENTQSPYSVASSGAGAGQGPSTMFPDSWQVPLTADWQFGEDLWAGLFRTETGSGSSAPQNASMPILNAESFLNGPDASEAESHNQNFPMNGNASYMGYGTQIMGYNFMPAPAMSQGQGQGSSGDQDTQDMEHAQSIFSNAFMGMFP